MLQIDAAHLDRKVAEASNQVYAVGGDRSRQLWGWLVEHIYDIRCGL